MPITKDRYIGIERLNHYIEGLWHQAEYPSQSPEPNPIYITIPRLFFVVIPFEIIGIPFILFFKLVMKDYEED